MTTALAYPPRSPAPWAEVVTGYGPVTVEILLTLPDDGYVYEVVEGVLVRVAGSGNRATTLAAVLLAALVTFVRPRRLGRVTGADGVYKFPGAETGSYAIIGGGAFLAASMQGPLSGVVLVLELTRNFDSLMAPTLLAVVEATVIARRLGAPSIYSAGLRT